MNSEHISFGGYCLKNLWILKFLLKIILSIFILKTFYLSDPFGLSSASKFYSKTLFYQWTTDFYKGKANNPVSVVILRDESFEGDWPVKAIVHAEILEAIADLNPKAVFVDFAFIDRRDDETLKNELIPIINSSYKGPRNLYFLALTPTPAACTLKIFEGSNIENEITLFKNKYKSTKETESKKNKCAVLITHSKKAPHPWIITGYSDKNEFENKNLTTLADRPLLDELRERSRSIEIIKELLAQQNINLNLNNISCFFEKGFTSNKCPIQLLPSVNNTSEFKITGYIDKQKINITYDDQDKKLSMVFINVFQSENRIIALSTSKIGMVLDGSTLGVLPELSATSNVNLVSGPSEDMKFPGIKYSSYPKWPLGISSKKPPAAAFKIYNDAHPKDKLAEEDIELVWRTYSGKGNNGPYKCITLCNGFFIKFFQRISPDFLKKLIAKSFSLPCLERDIRQQCPPIPTIDAHFLLNPNDESLYETKKLIKNKYVFYGGDLDAVNDLVYPPTHNEIPGVYFNAMAMDNLLTYKNNYIRHPSTAYTGSKKAKNTVYWLEFWGLVFLLILKDHYRKIINTDWKETEDVQFFSVIKKWFCILSSYVVISGVFLAGLVIFGFFVKHTPPIDFISLYGILGITLIPSVGRYYEKIKYLLYEQVKNILIESFFKFFKIWHRCKYGYNWLVKSGWRLFIRAYKYTCKFRKKTKQPKGNHDD